MPRTSKGIIPTDPHSLRLIQQVPAGTPEAFGPDAIFGKYWKASRSGLNGQGGFISVEHDPTLNDASKMIVLLPPTGSDAVSAGDRLYCLPSQEEAPEPPGVSYFPGDEWFEVYRGRDELVAIGTPTDPIHVDGAAGQVSLTCDDVIGSVLLKTRETAGGFWVNAPRDVFEHYSRAWLAVAADDFTDRSQFPTVPAAGPTTTPNGLWTLRYVASDPSGTLVQVGNSGGGAGGTGSITSVFTWPDAVSSHGCWRAETSVQSWSQGLSTSTFALRVQESGGAGGTQKPYYMIQYNQAAPGQNLFSIWGLNSSGAAHQYGSTLSSSAFPNAPWTLALEARDRWVLAYVNGQLIGSIPRVADLSGGSMVADFTVASGTGIAKIDYLVIRRTSPPMNGGVPGDYFLPSAPAPGGLNGEYFDMAGVTGLVSTSDNQALFGSPTFSVSAAAQPQPRLDPTLYFAGIGGVPSWQVPFVGAFAVRWTGSIYLPLGEQDVVFQLPGGYASNADQMRVWVGKTRAGEQILTNWTGDPLTATSVGMRSWLGGSISGWYPILVEYIWVPTNSAPPWTGNSNPGFTYNVAGGGVVPLPYGNGSDGSATLDGTATVAWATKSGSTYTMTRDANLVNLTVNSGVTLVTNSWRLQGTGTLSGGGDINNNGLAGANGSGSQVAGVPSNSFAGSGHGGQGSDFNLTYGSTPGGNSPGTAGGGAAGGGGGSNGNGFAPPSAGGAAAAGTVPTPLGSLFTASATAVGGGGGGGGGGNDTSAGGGAGGGVCGVAFEVLNFTGTIRANGGNGGTGSGGGGGGGGGLVALVYSSGTLPTLQANGGLGNGGNPGGGGSQWGGGPPSAGAAGQVLTEVVTSTGNTIPDATVLSPLGLVHQQIRNDSHYDTLRQIADQFVYQFRSQPMALESGSFPGVVVPRARVGRDTDKILDSTEGLDPTLDIHAKDVAATLLASASGLGGTATGALSIEAFNYPAMASHPFVVSDLENLPQHTFPSQLVQNLISLLGYRSAPFEDLQSKQIGARTMQDSFPLTGSLAEFDWQPGDGLRVQLETLFVKDATPRQILSLQRFLYRDGMGDCIAALRPRIRSPEATVRKFLRQVYGARRTFQGQLVNVEGTHVTAPNASEVALPTDLTTVRQAILIVLSKADTTTSYNVQVNGTTAFSITQAKTYDLGPYVAKNVSAVNNAPEPRMLVALTGGTACTYCVQIRTLVPVL